MKSMITLIMAMFLFVGCSTITDAIYGPDLTPEQLINQVYKDAYAIGSIRASGSSPEQIKAFIDEASEVKSYTNPEDYLTKKFLEALKEGDEQNAFIYYTARRLYNRVGAKLVNDNVDVSSLNLDLFNHAVNAYIDGLNGTLD